MHARSTTLRGRPSEINSVIRYVTEQVMPAITTMDGCVGLSMLADRDSGRCIATSAWNDEQSMHAADAALRPMRKEAGTMIGGDPVVEEWEIAVLHRDHRTSDSTSVRCAWLRTNPARMDEIIELFRSEVLPVAESLDGFCSVSLMVDRSSGRAVSSVTWDSRQAMEATRETAKKMRAKMTNRTGAEFEDVAEFELALAHFRVPELV